MKNLNLIIPDKTYEHLRSVALFEDKTIEQFTKEILILAEREIWKTHGRSTQEMLTGLDYFNKYCR